MKMPTHLRLAHVFREIGRPLAVLFTWDVIVTMVYFKLNNRLEFPALPVSLLGSAIAVYLSFRNSTVYARWWEARTLWGAMVNHSRSFTRDLYILLPEEQRALRKFLILRHIAYVHALGLHLRRQEPWEELAPRLPANELRRLRSASNVPNAILTRTASILAQQSRLNSVELAAMQQTMSAFSIAQGGMERIKNTPMPKQYSIYPAIYTSAFCLLMPLGLVESLGVFTPLGSTAVGFLFLALLQIGDDMEHPFSNCENSVPLKALTHTIETDLRDCLRMN